MIQTILFILILAFTVSGQIENEFQEYLKSIRAPLDTDPEWRIKALQQAIEEDKKRAEQDRRHLRLALEQQAENLRNVEVTIAAACNLEGRLYGSVGPREIAAALRDEGHDVEPKQVQLHDPLRQLDTIAVPVVFADDISVDVKIWIVRESGSGELEPEAEAEETPQPEARKEADRYGHGSDIDALETDL